MHKHRRSRTGRASHAGGAPKMSGNLTIGIEAKIGSQVVVDADGCDLLRVRGLTWPSLPTTEAATPDVAVSYEHGGTLIHRPSAGAADSRPDTTTPGKPATCGTATQPRRSCLSTGAATHGQGRH